MKTAQCRLTGAEKILALTHGEGKWLRLWDSLRQGLDFGLVFQKVASRTGGGVAKQSEFSFQVSLIIELEGCIDLSAGEHVYRYSRREDHLRVQGFDGSWQSVREDPNAKPIALRLHGFPHVRCI